MLSGGIQSGGNVSGVRRAGLKTLEIEEQYHPTSSYLYAPITGAAYTAVESAKIGLEKAGLPNLANAIGIFNGGAGVVGITVDLFRLAGLKDKPYTTSKATPTSRIILAAGAGTMLGLGMVPDPKLRYAFAGTAALRRSFIETLGYAFYGDISVNPHAAMIASGFIALGRSFIPYWGNPPILEGKNGGERFFNGITDTTGEVIWEFGASILASGIQQIVEGSDEGKDFWSYPKKRLIPSLIPPALTNLYAAPIRPHSETLAQLRETARHAGFNMDPFFGEKVSYRRRLWGSEASHASAAVPLFLDFRPSMIFEPGVYSRFLWAPPSLSFQERWNLGYSAELEFFEVAIHEALHLGASYGFYAQGPDGEFHLYGGEGPILHHFRYIFESAWRPHDERPGEKAENEWSDSFLEESLDCKNCFGDANGS